jgi:hypothetical protein
MAQAEEVGVTILGALNGEAPPAHPAVKESLQVMGVLGFPGAARRMVGELRL